MLSEFALVIVAYGTARYGSVLVLWASLLSVPAGWVVALTDVNLYGAGLPGLAIRVAARLTQSGVRPTSAVIAAGGVVLLVPWLLGFALRMRDRALASQAVNASAERARAEAEDQRAQAQQLAEVRGAEQTPAGPGRARCGRSLTNGYSRSGAGAGDYLRADDPERLERAERDIADSPAPRCTTSPHTRRDERWAERRPGHCGRRRPGGCVADRGPRPAGR